MMMQRRVSRSLLVGLLVVLALGLGALAQSVSLTVTSYSDAVRFSAQGSVKELRVEILSLSGQKVFDSGPVLSNALDWKLLNTQGQPVANGVYIYAVTVKDPFGNVTRKLGKLAVLRGKGGAAPSLSGISVGTLANPRLQPLGGPDFGTSTVAAGHFNARVSFVGAGIWGIANGQFPQLVFGDAGDTYITMQWYSSADYGLIQTYIAGVASGPLALQAGGGNVGIGTSSPSAKVHINNSANQPGLRIDSSDGQNALEIYNTGTGSATGLIFRVERATGNVYADGSFTGGGADVAERIDASEQLEPGDVVEIDPDNPGKFRKAREAVSTRVAGVISTAPGVVLGNKDAVSSSDARPILALAGRVPVKATAKFGTIQVGDLLVSSPIPGYAMKCPEASQCIGAVIGKALESLREGVGVIEVQVMLR
ncbi:MAG: hypothetical protein QXS68_05720 [Candidatus Methanomethylicaceae archaeon]